MLLPVPPPSHHILPHILFLFILAVLIRQTALRSVPKVVMQKVKISEVAVLSVSKVNVQLSSYHAKILISEELPEWLPRNGAGGFWGGEFAEQTPSIQNRG